MITWSKVGDFDAFLPHFKAFQSFFSRNYLILSRKSSKKLEIALKTGEKQETYFKLSRKKSLRSCGSSPGQITFPKKVRTSPDTIFLEWGSKIHENQSISSKNPQCQKNGIYGNLSCDVEIHLGVIFIVITWYQVNPTFSQKKNPSPQFWASFRVFWAIFAGFWAILSKNAKNTENIAKNSRKNTKKSTNFLGDGGKKKIIFHQNLQTWCNTVSSKSDFFASFCSKWRHDFLDPFSHGSTPSENCLQNWEEKIWHKTRAQKMKSAKKIVSKSRIHLIPCFFVFVY